MENLKKKQESLEHLRKDANRKVNLTYLLAGAYFQSLEMANEAMDAAVLELRHSDKKITNEIRQLTKRLIYLIDQLQNGSVLELSDSEALTHENTIHMFFALFMGIIEAAGIDKYSDLRVYQMYNMISKYPKRVNFKFLQTKEHMAFNFVKERIANDQNISEDSEGNILVTENGKKKQVLIKR